MEEKAALALSALGYWGQQYATPCKCNIAHTKVFNIDQLLIEWGKRGLPIKEREEIRKNAEEALRCLHLAGKLKYFGHQGGETQLSINCTHFLVKALMSISDIPESFITESENYWAAYSMVCVQLVNCAKKEGLLVPAKDMISKVSVIFSGEASEGLRCEITRGLADVIANVDTYDEWEKLKDVLGEMIDGIFDHWLGKMRDTQEHRSKELSIGAASSIDIWYYLAGLYARTMVDSSIKEELSESIKTFRDDIFDKALSVLEILEVFYKTNGPFQEVSCSDRFKDQLHNLKKFSSEEGVKEKIDLVAERTRGIREKTKNPRVRWQFDEILRSLGYVSGGKKISDDEFESGDIGDELAH